MSLERRKRLAAIAEELHVLVVEDDPYGLLRYKGASIPPLASVAAGSPWVLYLSSFSKVLAPGLRVAWAVGAPELVRAMVVLRQGVDLCTPNVTQSLAAEYCRRGHLERHLARIVGHYARKRDDMARSLSAEIPKGALEWDEPEGGFFFWLRLRDRDSGELFKRAIAEKVAFLPGNAFYPDPGEQVGEVQQGTARARLCFTFADATQTTEGCRRLARAL
jgi:2-aminoadipate transaminase